MGLTLPPEDGERSASAVGADSAGSPDGVAVPLDLLRLAGERVMERWEGMPGGWMVTRAEASAALSHIIRAVERTRKGDGSPVPESEPASRPLLRHRLAEALRFELLAVCDPEEDRPATDLRTAVRLLQALERYRVGLWERNRHDLKARMAEPDAFELVVEVAHNLRSPLNSILFLSEVLRTGHSGPVNDQQQRQLGLMYSASLEMLSLVTDLMDMASDHRCLEEDDPVPFHIGGVFNSVDELVRPMAEEKGLDLEFRPPDYDRRLGTPGLLRRVLLNLTTNAVKFTDSGGVTVSAQAVDRARVEFSVRDTGPGIPAEEQDRLFEPFRSSPDRSEYQFSGSGLGLSIARRLAEAMGAELGVDTEQGGGTRFFFQVELPPA